MVVPYDSGDLVRSLVRVPGSGFDKNAGSKSLDLSKVSSLAAMVYVPSELPSALVTPKKPQPPLPKESICQNRKRPLPNDSLSNNNNPKKMCLTLEGMVKNAIPPFILTTPSGPIVCYIKQQETPPPLDLTQASLTELIKLRDHLMLENKELQKKLAIFKQLFRDKTE